MLTEDQKDINYDKEQLLKDKERVFEDLKIDLNNFMYIRVPSTMTIGEFETLTVEMCKLVYDSWKVVDKL